MRRRLIAGLCTGSASKEREAAAADSRPPTGEVADKKIDRSSTSAGGRPQPGPGPGAPLPAVPELGLGLQPSSVNI